MRSALQLAMPFGATLVLVLAGGYADPDLWGRLAVAAIVIRAGFVPHSDDFSFTAGGGTWIDHEWLSGLLFYPVFAVGGDAALVLMKLLFLALALACSLAVAALAGRVAESGSKGASHGEEDTQRRAPRSSRAAAAIAIAALLLTLQAPLIATGFLTTLRAQLFSLVGFGCSMWLLEALRSERIRLRWILLLPALAIPWGNAHGGFVMAVLAAGLYAAAALLRGRVSEALVLGAAAFGMILAVAIVNPYGPVYAEFLLHAWTLDRSAINEWTPLLETGNAWAIGVALIAAVVALLALLRSLRALAQSSRGAAAPASRDHDPDVAHAALLGPVLVLCLLVVMTLLAQRIQPFLALWLGAVVPIIAPGSVRWLAHRSSWFRYAPACVVVLVCGINVAALARQHAVLDVVVPQRFAAPPVKTVYPVGAVAYLRASPYSGRILNSFNHGEYLLWTLYPKFRVSIDGRYEEVYSQAQFRDVRDFFDFELGDGPSMFAYLERNEIDIILFRAQWRSYLVMHGQPGWLPVYNDGQFALLARESMVAKQGRFVLDTPAPTHVTLGDYFAPEDRARFSEYPSQAPGA